MSCTTACAAEVSFATPPRASRSGDQVRIEFSVDRPTDVAVYIEDADGNVVRHLIAGVLGENPPEPLVPDSRSQADEDETCPGPTKCAGVSTCVEMWASIHTSVISSPGGKVNGLASYFRLRSPGGPVALAGSIRLLRSISSQDANAAAHVLFIPSFCAEVDVLDRHRRGHGPNDGNPHSLRVVRVSPPGRVAVKDSPRFAAANSLGRLGCPTGGKGFLSFSGVGVLNRSSAPESAWTCGKRVDGGTALR